jgi:hypothetical protein
LSLLGRKALYDNDLRFVIYEAACQNLPAGLHRLSEWQGTNACSRMKLDLFLAGSDNNAGGPVAKTKRRTRQHVIADQSVNYVERFVIDEGHTPQKQVYDYGYDLSVITYDKHGYVEPGFFYVQLKAAENLDEKEGGFVFDLDLRDFNLWMLELMPVFLVLFDASKRRAYWLHIQRYFRQDPDRLPRKSAKTVRVRVPRRQPVNHRTIAVMREIKQDLLTRIKGVSHDG